MLQVFRFLADFMTKDRTTRSGFAFTPPLLESMNINLVGRLDCLLDAGRSVSLVSSCLSCASIWFWCHLATVVLWICGCKDCTLVAGVEGVSIAVGDVQWFDDAKKEVHSGLRMSFNPEVWDSYWRCFDDEKRSGRASRP